MAAFLGFCYYSSALISLNNLVIVGIELSVAGGDSEHVDKIFNVDCRVGAKHPPGATTYLFRFLVSRKRIPALFSPNIYDDPNGIRPHFAIEIRVTTIYATFYHIYIS